MDTAPRCGRSVLLFCRIHGQVEGWFDQGYWTENQEGREYTGSAWVLGDDLEQIEVEEPLNGEPESRWHDGSLIAWRERHAPPDWTA